MSNGNRMPPRDYLELERRSEARHEYMLGQAMQVPGGSPNHSLIVANSCTALGRRLAGSGKRVFDASLRVCLDVETSIYVYPDLTVVEGAVQTLEDADETVTNPKVVFEVLSPATRGIELGEKARMYVRVASLTDLVIIDQDRVLVEHWERREANHWDVSAVRDRSGVVRLASIGCEIPVPELYAGVEWKGPRAVD
jgi:Uma2 family endonuclease